VRGGLEIWSFGLCLSSFARASISDTEIQILRPIWLKALMKPCSTPQGQAESGGMVLIAYAGPVRPAARAPSGSAARQRVVPTDRHSFVVCQ